MYKIKVAVLIAVVVSFFAGIASADTLNFKNGKEEKGLIVKEFSDRIIFSTVDGKREILLSNIKSIIYDDEERRLLQLGRNQLKREEYVDAYRTFEDVIKIDPDNEEAIERRIHLRNYLENATYSTVGSDVKTDSEYFEGKIPEEPQELIQQRLGIILEKEKNFVYVREVDKLGREYGFKKDDRIISVWGENTVFSEIPEIVRLLVSSREVHLKVERRVSLQLGDRNWFLRTLGGYNVIVGATLKRDKSGLVVRKVISNGAFEKGGIVQGDIIVAMNDLMFGYLPFKNVASLIIRNHGKHVEIIIHRKLMFWGRG